mmetsp:Transcript_19758/g.64234  ORF Transcript_19758/g.64234 Transcript_19758/m.64234 type:complete len:363 (-) Transcript_19758:21-1109(-)
MPRLRRRPSERRRVPQRSVVEGGGREARDGRVHPVLRREQRHLLPSLLQPLEERLLVVVPGGRLGKDCGGELLRVAHQDQPAARIPQRDERRDLDSLRRLVDQYRVEAVLERVEHGVAGAGERGAHDLRLVEHLDLGGIVGEALLLQHPLLRHHVQRHDQQRILHVGPHTHHLRYPVLAGRVHHPHDATRLVLARQDARYNLVDGCVGRSADHHVTRWRLGHGATEGEPPVGAARPGVDGRPGRPPASPRGHAGLLWCVDAGVTAAQPRRRGREEARNIGGRRLVCEQGRRSRLVVPRLRGRWVLRGEEDRQDSQDGLCLSSTWGTLDEGHPATGERHADGAELRRVEVLLDGLDQLLRRTE